MSLPFLQDLWIYDDPECAAFLRRLWWRQSFNSQSLEIIAEGSASRETFVERISTALLTSQSNFFSARGDSRLVEFFISNVQKNQWYFVAFIHMDDPIYDNSPSSIAVSIYPLKSKIADHLKTWITLQLFEPRMRGIDDLGNAIY